jgi:IS30 family transposase
MNPTPRTERPSVRSGTDFHNFCDPQSPWQRGTNENTNRLLRQYLPKGTDVAAHSQAELNRIAHRLNTRPRKTLDYRTPADIFAAAVAMTG